jgi:hypothetical protein
MLALNWRPVAGYEGLYAISPIGVIQRCDTSRYATGKPLHQRLSSNGYYNVSLCSKGRPRVYSVHRLVAETFIGKRPDDKDEINHKDGNKANNHYRNLEWVTTAENVAHAFALRLRPLGESHHQAKLGVEDVRKIRVLAGRGVSQSRIAKRFGMSQSSIGSIIRGETWKEIT